MIWTCIGFANANKGTNGGDEWQRVWIALALICISMELIWKQTADSIILGYAIPNLVTERVLFAQNTLIKLSTALIRNTIGLHENINNNSTNNTINHIVDFHSFSASDYLYESNIVARHFPHLIESSIVLSYRNPLPGDHLYDNSLLSSFIHQGLSKIEGTSYHIQKLNLKDKISKKYEIDSDEEVGMTRGIREKGRDSNITTTSINKNSNNSWLQKLCCRIPGIYTISCAILLLFGRSPDYISNPIVEGITPVIGTIFLRMILILLDSTSSSQLKLFSLIGIIIILLLLFWPIWHGILLLNNESKLLSKNKEKEEEEMEILANNNITTKNERLNYVDDDFILMQVEENNNEEDVNIDKKKKKYDSSTSALSRLKQTKDADPAYRKAQREAQRKAEKEKKKKLLSDKAKRVEDRLAIGRTNDIKDSDDDNNNNDDNIEKNKRRRTDRRRRRKDDYKRRERKNDRKRHHHHGRDKRHRHRRRHDSDSNSISNTNSDSEESVISKSELGKATDTLYQQKQQQFQFPHHQSLSSNNNNNPYMNTTPYGTGYGYLPPTDTNMLINSFGIAATIGADDSVPVSYPSNFGYQSNNNDTSLQIQQQQQHHHQQQQQLLPINDRTFGNDVNFSSDAESPNESLSRKLKSLKLSDQSINRYHNPVSSDDGHSISSNLSIPTSILYNKSITRKERLGDIDSSTTEDASDIEIRITQRNRNKNRNNDNNSIRRNHNRSTSDILSDIRALSSHLDDFNEEDDDDDDDDNNNNHTDDLSSVNQLPIRVPKNRHLRLGGDGTLNEMLHYAAVLNNEEIDDDVAHFVSNMKENKEHDNN